MTADDREELVDYIAQMAALLPEMTGADGARLGPLDVLRRMTSATFRTDGAAMRASVRERAAAVVIRWLDLPADASAEAMRTEVEALREALVRTGGYR